MLRLLKSALIALIAVSPLACTAYPTSVSFSSPPSQVNHHDFVEVSAFIQHTDAVNPFEDGSLTGVVETVDGAHRPEIEGFCDSADGNTFGIRFMAQEATKYK